MHLGILSALSVGIMCKDPGGAHKPSNFELTSTSFLVFVFVEERESVSLDSQIVRSLGEALVPALQNMGKLGLSIVK